MAVYKEEKTNTWRVIYRYTDWNGERKQSQKRGFKTKREAQAWEREQLNKMGSDLDMTFKSLKVAPKAVKEFIDGILERFKKQKKSILYEPIPAPKTQSQERGKHSKNKNYER